MARYTYETTLSFGSDERADFAEVDVKVAYDVSFGRAATRLDPAEDDEITDIRLIEVGGRPAPWGLHFHSDKHFAAIVAEMLEESEADLEAMIANAHEEAAADYDRAMEARWEARQVWAAE